MSNFKETKRFIENSADLLELFKRSSSSSASGGSTSASAPADGLDSSDQPASAAPGKATFNKKYAKCLEDLKSQGIETADIINSKSFTFPIKGLCFNAGYDVGTMGRKGKKGVVKARKSVSGKRTELVHAQAGIQNNDWTPKHKGIDIFCLNGQSKLVACVTGVITKIGKNSGRGGNTITVTRGPPGNAENFYYAHLSGHAQGFSEKKDIGKRVSIGTVIGYCGKTGSAQGTFPHLHFSYYVGGTYGNSNTDPWPYLGPSLRGMSQRVGKSRKIRAYAKISPEEAQKAVAACPPPGKGLGESRGSRYGLVTEDFIMFNRTYMSPERQNETFKRAAKAVKRFFTGGDDKKDDVKSSGSGGVADRAEAEWLKWNKGKTDEGDPKMKDTLSAYWKNAEAPDYGTKQPWSAAFITYVVEPPAKVDKSSGKVKVVKNDTDFEGDAAHMKYMKAAKKARDDGKKSGYVAYQPSETEPNRGDIVCRPRGTGDGWKKIGTKNHCDIYVGNNQMIGGNLGNTSKKVPYNKKKASMIIKKLAEQTAEKTSKREREKAFIERSVQKYDLLDRQNEIFKRTAAAVGNVFTGGSKIEKEKEGAGVVMPVNDKKLTAVDANFRPIVEKIMGLLKGQGFNPMIGSAYRSPKSQQDKIDKGYSKTKTVFGYHVALDAQGNRAARAVDLVNKGDGWSNTKSAFDFFEALGKIANSPEFKGKVQWGGNWSPKKKTIGGKEYFIGWDPAHIQTRAMTMKQSAQVTKQGIAALKSQGKDMESIAERKNRKRKKST